MGWAMSLRDWAKKGFLREQYFKHGKVDKDFVHACGELLWLERVYLKERFDFGPGGDDERAYAINLFIIPSIFQIGAKNQACFTTISITFCSISSYECVTVTVAATIASQIQMDDKMELAKDKPGGIFVKHVWTDAKERRVERKQALHVHLRGLRGQRNGSKNIQEQLFRQVQKKRFVRANEVKMGFFNINGKRPMPVEPLKLPKKTTLTKKEKESQAIKGMQPISKFLKYKNFKTPGVASQELR
ncbi:hypothetical protein BDK51DRAFT_28892 [Blyttiomyces helicus]|uniref:Uncharacterized protein n=1 Tax=Blyttiomyces helicus TaxID=388810 RepID=A0A4V1IRK5_9FUNG|nr:hypothetical protein BDK51DRAFT_28892 [Blyttiomyces helicus]|eukprot:RKO90377.1 hypothetical protein BDK51DRAFT_28892 [Blyttiomyces helicus]